MITDLNKILVEWSYRTSDGQPDVNNSAKLLILESVLNDFGWSEEARAELLSTLMEGDEWWSKMTPAQQAAYIKKHPLWNKLFERGNFSLDNFSTDTITPILVPHRSDDFETHALLIEGIKGILLFLPDHDDWDSTLLSVNHDSPKDWFRSLNTSVVLLDGTFWDKKELTNRVQSKVPHPAVKETLQLIGKRQEGDPRIVFIHLNHTNPLHYPDSEQYRQVYNMGWEVGVEGMEFEL